MDYFPFFRNGKKNQKKNEIQDNNSLVLGIIKNKIFSNPIQSDNSIQSGGIIPVMLHYRK